MPLRRAVGGWEARAGGVGVGRASELGGLRTQRAPVGAACPRGALSLTGPSGSLQLFHRCQRAVQALPSRARRTCSEQEERLLRNVVASLAQALQELSAGFRHAQAGYLRRECGAAATGSPLGPEPLTVTPRVTSAPWKPGWCHVVDS